MATVQSKMQTSAKSSALTASRPWTRARVMKIVSKAMVYLVLLLGSMVFILPFIWMVSSSLKTQTEIFIFPPNFIPRALLWENYPKALTAAPFSQYFLNSIFVSSMVVLGTVISSSMVGYGFARVRGWGRNVLFGIVLATMMLPNQVTMIPTFIIFRNLGWVNTFAPLTIPHFFGGAFNIFLFRQFFMSISNDISDAAKIDGCNHFNIYWRIIMPMSTPVLMTVAILAFFWSWNDLLGPLIYLNAQRLYTVPLGLTMFQQAYSIQTPWHYLMAASVVAVLPLILTFFLVQRFFIQGIVFIGVK
jgi:ABC-type glycerol-3-phosphate transport system permease component